MLIFTHQTLPAVTHTLKINDFCRTLIVKQTNTI